MSTEKGGGGWRLATSGAEGGDRVRHARQRMGGCVRCSGEWLFCEFVARGALVKSLTSVSQNQSTEIIASRRKLSQ
jgi:hypothetical protein